jgi:hypothetical protein
VGLQRGFQLNHGIAKIVALGLYGRAAKKAGTGNQLRTL